MGYQLVNHHFVSAISGFSWVLMLLQLIPSLAFRDDDLSLSTEKLKQNLAKLNDEEAACRQSFPSQDEIDQCNSSENFVKKTEELEQKSSECLKTAESEEECLPIPSDTQEFLAKLQLESQKCTKIRQQLENFLKCAKELQSISQQLFNEARKNSDKATAIAAQKVCSYIKSEDEENLTEKIRQAFEKAPKSYCYGCIDQRLTWEGYARKIDAEKGGFNRTAIISDIAAEFPEATDQCRGF